MGKSLLKSILENIGLNKPREVFADYGLHPEKYPKLNLALKEYEERKLSKKFSFEKVYFKTCPACGIVYISGNEICSRCLDVYENENLFWKQGKKL